MASMHLYSLMRVEEDYDYDNYDGFIVIAPSEEEAIKLINDEHPTTIEQCRDGRTPGWKIEHIGVTDAAREARIVLAGWR